MKTLINAWKGAKTNLDIWFFYAFLLTFPLSIRKILFSHPINGGFNEYTSIYIYLSDILLFLTLVFWMIRLCNKSCILSNRFLTSSLKKILRLVKKVPPARNASQLNQNCSTPVRRGGWNTIKTFFVPILPMADRTILLIPVILVIWSIFSLIWAENKFIGIFKIVKLAELCLIFLYLKNVPRGTFHKILGTIIGLGVLNSIIGIGQFLLQQSLGLTFLRESIISPNLPGVAKIIIGGEKYIRAYGLLPHPNVLGGLLLISITLTLYYKLFHVEQIESKKLITTQSNIPRLSHGMFHVEHSFRGGTILDNTNQDKCSTWNIKQWQPKNLIFWLILWIQILGIILTVSKSAILGLLVALFYLKNVPRGTNPKSEMFHAHAVEYNCSTWNKQVDWIKDNLDRIRQFGLVALISIMLAYLIHADLNSILFNSLRERLLYLNVSRGTILNHFWLGTGIGQYVVEIPNNFKMALLSHEYQPVHNIFLMIWSELGIIGLGIFIWLLLKMFHVEHFISLFVPRGTNCTHTTDQNCSALEWNNFVVFQGVLAGLIFIGLFDHYFWDIQQGQILLWIIFGLLAKKCSTPVRRGG